MLQGFFRYCWRININGFSRKAEADLREKVFSHLQTLPLSYFQHNKTGDLMSRLTIDIQAVRELLGFGSLASVDAIITIIFSLACMLYIDPWLTLWSLLAMPMITVTVRYFGRHIFRWSHSVQEQLSDISAYVQENLAGMRVVQVYAQEDNQIRGFHKISSECMRKNMWLATLWGIFWPLMRVVSGIAATVVLWLGGRQVLQGTMSLGEFVAFNGYLGDVNLAVNGDRLRCQSVSARHRCLEQDWRSSRRRTIAAIRRARFLPISNAPARSPSSFAISILATAITGRLSKIFHWQSQRGRSAPSSVKQARVRAL